MKDFFSAELGDYDPSRHSPGYVSEFRFLANQTEEQEVGVGDESLGEICNFCLVLSHSSIYIKSVLL